MSTHLFSTARPLSCLNAPCSLLLHVGIRDANLRTLCDCRRQSGSWGHFVEQPYMTLYSIPVSFNEQHLQGHRTSQIFMEGESKYVSFAVVGGL